MKNFVQKLVMLFLVKNNKLKMVRIKASVDKFRR